MNQQIIAEADDWLKHSTRLPLRQRHSLAGLAPRLLGRLPQDHRPVVIGLGGPPGTGKSTLAGMLCALLQARGVTPAHVALDDYYRTQAERTELAARIHPLLAVRGVPGTHDLGLLLRDLDGLLHGKTSDLALPRFDKAKDDRKPAPGAWHGPPPRVIFLEGWCVGCPPQTDATVGEQPVNATERVDDADGRWRAWVNSQLAEYERELHARLDQRWFLSAPNWDSIIGWRWRQEQELGPRKRLQNAGQVRTFLATFERISRTMQASYPDWADLAILLDDDHCVRGVTEF